MSLTVPGSCHRSQVTFFDTAKDCLRRLQDYALSRAAAEWAADQTDQRSRLATNQTARPRTPRERH
jgi:hypothetical protein